MKNKAITEEYAEKILPLLHLAQRAYGAKDQNTPAHEASRLYTYLLVEYVTHGGSLTELARALDVSYSGLRRRVFTANVPVMKTQPGRRKLTQEQIDEAIARVRTARAQGTARYHEQLAIEYQENGVSLSLIAKGLGIANAGPLYYGVQRHTQRTASAVQ